MNIKKFKTATLVSILLTASVLAAAALASYQNNSVIKATPIITEGVVEIKTGPQNTPPKPVTPAQKPNLKPSGLAADNTTPDLRLPKLEAFFAKYKCPDQQYAQNYLDAADKAGIDWRLLPAISLGESTCGKVYPPETHNEWGFGCSKGVACYISTNGSNLRKFDSVAEGISYVSDQLGHGSVYAGKTTQMKLVAYNGATYALRIENYMNAISTIIKN